MHARTCCACDQDTSIKDVRPHAHTNACVCACVCSEELAKITGESGHWHIKGRKRSLAYKGKKAVIGGESEKRGIREMIEKGEFGQNNS